MIPTTCGSEAPNRGTVPAFIQERRRLKNITTKTLAWYGDAFKAFDGALESELVAEMVTLEGLRVVSFAL